MLRWGAGTAGGGLVSSDWRGDFDWWEREDQ